MIKHNYMLVNYPFFAFCVLPVHGSVLSLASNASSNYSAVSEVIRTVDRFSKISCFPNDLVLPPATLTGNEALPYRTIDLCVCPLLSMPTLEWGKDSRGGKVPSLGVMNSLSSSNHPLFHCIRLTNHYPDHLHHYWLGLVLHVGFMSVVPWRHHLPSMHSIPSPFTRTHFIVYVLALVALDEN